MWKLAFFIFIFAFNIFTLGETIGLHRTYQHKSESLGSSEESIVRNDKGIALVFSNSETVNSAFKLRNKINRQTDSYAKSIIQDDPRKITTDEEMNKRSTPYRRISDSLIGRQHQQYDDNENADYVVKSHRGTADFVMPSNDKSIIINHGPHSWTTTTEISLHRESNLDDYSSNLYHDRNDDQQVGNQMGRPMNRASNHNYLHSTDDNAASNQAENILSLEGSSAFHSFIKKRKKKKHRLCEEKYMEYMVRIFRDDDTVADATVSDLNGRDLVEPGEYPHMAALGYTGPDQPIDYKCGGSLISENFVLTAAHCTNLTGQAPQKVRIGDLNLMVEERYLEPQIRNIRRIFIHPQYSSHLYYNDIALLELEEPVEFTEFVRPIRLWMATELPENTTVHAMGYGATAFGKAPTHRLTDMTLTTVPNRICNRDMPEIPETPSGIISSQICARDYVMHRDTCQGDSGGPLQLHLRGRLRRSRKHYQLIGITSYGLVCGSNYPSVYTRSSKFLDWIEQIVWLAQH